MKELSLTQTKNGQTIELIEGVDYTLKGNQITILTGSEKGKIIVTDLYKV